MASQEDFLAGVIEGFYGPPWLQPERFELLDQLTGWGLNTYMYAPKDDLKHRAAWRECYTPAELDHLNGLLRRCQANQLRFVYALSPGLNIRYHDPAEIVSLQRRFEQLMAIGCDHFALLFDDIPDQIHETARKRWSSLAAAQSHVTNTLFASASQSSPQTRFMFCPTPYCERMARRGVGGPNYLQILGAHLNPEIDIFWTGPEIVSREIPVQGVRDLQERIRRKPVIWDNLHANDYDGRRFYCGPYSGRPLELRQEVRGLLSNPNNELPLNEVPLRTLGAYLQAGAQWDAREAYLAAMTQWRELLTTNGRPIALDDLVFLGDCYYLPHEEGPRARELFDLARRLTQTLPQKWGGDAATFLELSSRLRRFCVQLTELDRRGIFHALSRRIWELREELDLLESFVQWGQGDRGIPFTSDSHLLGAFRGGFVPRLQSLLNPQSDGSFAPPDPTIPRPSP